MHAGVISNHRESPTVALDETCCLPLDLDWYRQRSADVLYCVDSMCKEHLMAVITRRQS